MAQAFQQGEASGDQQYQQGHADHQQRLARRRRRKLGRALNAGMLMLGVLLDRLDLLVALSLRSDAMLGASRRSAPADLRLSDFVLCTHA